MHRQRVQLNKTLYARVADTLTVPTTTTTTTTATCSKSPRKCEIILKLTPENKKIFLFLHSMHTAFR